MSRRAMSLPGNPWHFGTRQNRTIPVSADGWPGHPGEAGNEDRAARKLHSRRRRLFCRAETEDGLYGWGEACVTQGKEKVVAECIRAMAPHGIGPCAFKIRHTAIAEPSAHYRCDMTPRWRRGDSNPRSPPRGDLDRAGVRDVVHAVENAEYRSCFARPRPSWVAAAQAVDIRDRPLRHPSVLR